MSASLQFQYAEILARILGARDVNYLLNAAYVEFENVSSPGDPVALPDYSEDDDRTYYERLALTPNRDYLRIAIDQPATLALADGYENRGARYNRMTFNVRTSGSVGVNGRTFSDLVNSTVYGLAIVAVPDWGDRTKDLVFTRRYYPAANQVPKAAGRQIALRYVHTWQPVG